MEIKLNREYMNCKAKDEVIKFIEKFIKCTNNEHADEIFKIQFTSGYCYYFATILKAAFKRGEVCWCAPYGHFVWLDTDDTPYDIYGISIDEAEYYIPVRYLGDCLDDFLHAGKVHNTSKVEIRNIIDKYLHDKNKINDILYKVDLCANRDDLGKSCSRNCPYNCEGSCDFPIMGTIQDCIEILSDSKLSIIKEANDLGEILLLLVRELKNDKSNTSTMSLF